MLDPDMPDQEMRLHMGELTAQEMRTARAAIRWANSQRGIRRCPVAGISDDDPECPNECPACGATLSGDDPVRGVCQAET